MCFVVVGIEARAWCILFAMRTSLSLATFVFLASGCGSSDNVAPPVAVAPPVEVAPPSTVAPTTPPVRVEEEAPAPTPIDAPAEGTCGGLVDAPRTQTWFLHQRAALTIPSAALGAAMHNIMEAPPSRAWREVGWAEQGEARMAIVASETHFRVDGVLIDGVRAWARPGWTVEAIDENVVAAFPSVLEADGTDARLATLYVRDAAHLIVALNLVTDPANAALGGCLAFARDLARSAVSGTDTVDTAARVATFERFEINVPEGFASTIDEGPDFNVFRIERIRDSEASPQASIGIYSGGYPSFDATGTPALTRSLLGADIAFYDTNEGALHRREALIRQEYGALHVFYGSTDAHVFEAVDQAVMSLRPHG